jgi:Flp pilus assembly protein TadB
MPKQHQSTMTNKHGLNRFIHVPSEGKHLSAMIISIIPSMPGGYMKILLPTPSATLKKNRTVDTPGEGLHNSTRM